MGLFKSKNQFPVEGRTVVVTGGSQGMGKSVAILLAQKGANVVIVARTATTLEAAIQEISAAAKSPSSQRFRHISADLTSPSAGAQIIAETTSWNNNRPPDIVWNCAGSAHPGLFIDTPIEVLKSQIDTNYLSTAYLAHAALRAWLHPGLKSTSSQSSAEPRHLIFTSSIAAFYPIIGYSAYSPSKIAVRALSDTLSQELQLYPASTPVRTHTIYPGTIFTAGLESENLLKPRITKSLEESDAGQTPEEVAAASLKGLERGEESVVTAWLGMAMRAASLGSSKRNGWGILDTIMSWIVSVVMVVVRRDMDGKVRKWGKVHGIEG
ncbi:Short-chain dehydrogenase/reductase SDR [Lasallia pustulata]|uniref:3-dehydrosphinganine reductase n=1 Tax=Lasallia pustulata TaxID=136370 RepID=A0A1W5D6B4_9LECA|nr:Short-chain dehydrogenase/reductase SDR [Lasallia pustulata]